MNEVLKWIMNQNWNEKCSSYSANRGMVKMEMRRKMEMILISREILMSPSVHSQGRLPGLLVRCL